METTAFFEKKIGLTPKELNKLRENSVDDLLIIKLRESLEEKCSEHGFVLPGSLKIISRSMGYYEHARFTGDAVYHVKLEGKVLYPADGIRVVGEVIRKNKLGLYVVYRDALRIQVPRDLHLGNQEFDEVEIGDRVEVELKKSRFQINDAFILTNGLFIRRESDTDKGARPSIAKLTTTDSSNLRREEGVVAAGEGEESEGEDETA